MDLPDPIGVRRVAIVGCGTIGASWAAHFLGRGMHVRAWDPAPDGEARLRAFVDNAWAALERLDIADGASRNRLTFHATPAEALEGAQFVQESAPEDVATKRALYEQFDTALPEGVVMSSSTSGLIMSELQAGRPQRDRYVVGHPFNPPHLIPLVEVLGGRDTSPAAIEWTMRFYDAWGKKAIRLNHEVPGHLVNRLQAALWREAMDAVLTGLASVADVDAAIKYGPGLRWGVMGPFELSHLAGGSGGYEQFLHHFGPGIAGWLRDMREVDLDDAQVRAKLGAAVGEALNGRSFESIAAERDALLLATMETLARVRRERELG